MTLDHWCPLQIESKSTQLIPMDVYQWYHWYVVLYVSYSLCNSPLQDEVKIGALSGSFQTWTPRSAPFGSEHLIEHYPFI